MPRKPGQVVQYRCKVCGEMFDTFGAMGTHAAAHRKAANAAPRSGARRIEDVSGPSDDAAPTDAGPVVGADGPDSPEPTAGRLRPSRPQLAQPSIRISPEQRTESVRDAIRDALPLASLADLLHAVSVAVSEADGAGPAGYLTPIQCTQVAFLLYDSTVDLVASRFDGNVSRFKAVMAVTIILASKGTIHARAISGRLAERRAGGPVPLPLPTPEPIEDVTNGHAPDLIIPGVPIPPGMGDAYAAALERQRAMQSEGPQVG